MRTDEWLALSNDELAQRREEGCELGDLPQRLKTLADSGADQQQLAELTEELAALNPRADFPYHEPSDLASTKQARPDGPRQMKLSLTQDQLLDREQGAWLGRSAGCLLGKPVEGWRKAMIESYLEFAGDYPLGDYIRWAEGAPESERMKPHRRSFLRGSITFMARDDDMDYPILGLHTIEAHGPDFTAQHVADEWLARLPYHMVYTAERNAYRNLVNGLAPPESAHYINPHREWIGAQIRADIWGWTSPGRPEQAAERAFRDASVSHVKNGIYGEMFMAALIAAAFATDDLEQAIRIGLSEIPARCRLAEAVEDVLTWRAQHSDWREAWDRVNEKYGHYHGVHTINNACVVLLALLYGEGDFTRTIGIAVMGGWDTDCNGATAGSIAGIILGAKRVPPKWIDPLHDRIESSVLGYSQCKLSELALRTHKLALR